jgi:alpha-tubulin suppressor-like RCC1 family protein
MQRASPVAAAVDYSTISAGQVHTCALNAAGEAFCWGPNSFGKIGTGDPETAIRTLPRAVAGGLTFKSIAAGGNHTCALRPSGSAYCWGLGSSGQLGTGSTANRLTPSLVAASLVFTRIATGYAHTCGLVASGTLYCWGNNFYGQLGIGGNTNRSTPTAVPGRTFVRISTGGSHTCALVTVPGTAYCWGFNENGEVGDGTTLHRNVPTRVSGNRIYQDIAVGFSHVCAFTAQFRAFCWGWGAPGQLGNGTVTEVVLEPGAVAGDFQFVSLAAGNAHTCGITTTFTSCWGSNGYGQIGNGGIGGRYTVPGQIVTGTGRLEVITAGGAGGGPSHACALNDAGWFYCWGSNSHGQLGNVVHIGEQSGFPLRVFVPGSF